jgi:hypothetical protein
MELADAPRTHRLIAGELIEFFPDAGISGRTGYQSGIGTTESCLDFASN